MSLTFDALTAMPRRCIPATIALAKPCQVVQPAAVKCTNREDFSKSPAQDARPLADDMVDELSNLEGCGGRPHLIADHGKLPPSRMQASQSFSGNSSQPARKPRRS